jgi:hypothetical protein
VFADGQLVGGRLHDLQRQEGWNQYFMALAQFETRLALANDPDDTNPIYKELYDKIMQPAIREIGDEYPAWAADFAYTQTRDLPWTNRNINLLRSVFSQPLWAETAAGKALAEYFANVDPWRERMYRGNLAWDSNGAAPIRRQYDELILELRNRYGEDFSIIYDTWLEGDLQYGKQRRNVQNRELPERWILHHQVPWEEAWAEARNQAFSEFTSDVDQRAAFLKMRRLSLRALRIEERTGFNPQEERWQELNRDQKQQERLEMSMKPYVFMSPWERRKLRIATSEATEELWASVEQMKLEVYESIDANPNTDPRVFWDQYNIEIEKIMKENPVFAREIRRNQTWAMALFKTLPQVHKRWFDEGREADAWRELQILTEGIHDVFHNAEFVDEDEYRRVRNYVGEWIDEWRDWSPSFDKHYAYLQGLAGESLLDLFVPEFWWIKA